MRKNSYGLRLLDYESKNSMMKGGTVFGGRLVVVILFALLTAGLIVQGFPIVINSTERDLVDPSLEGGAIVRALTSLKQDQRTSLVKREKERLKAEPLDRSALNNLALLESLADNTGQAEAFALESASRTLRDIQSQLSVLNSLIVKKDYAKAMYHLDGILVSDPLLGPKLYPGVSELLGDDKAASHLAKTLNRDPPWRREFLTWLIVNDKSDQITFKILNQLRRQGGAATSDEVQGYLTKLVGRKDYDKAYFVWLDSLDQAALRKVGNVFDGGFELEPKSQYFDWTLDPLASGEVGIIPKRDDPGERVLRLSFYNSTQMFGHVSQYLRLRPGAYRFSGEETANNLKAVGGLRFVLTCAESGAVQGTSAAFRDSTPWQSFSFDFDIPSEACSTQVLRLQSASPAVLDAKLDGEMLFNNIRITSSEVSSEQQGNQ